MYSEEVLKLAEKISQGNGEISRIVRMGIEEIIFFHVKSSWGAPTSFTLSLARGDCSVCLSVVGDNFNNHYLCCTQEAKETLLLALSPLISSYHAEQDRSEGEKIEAIFKRLF